MINKSSSTFKFRRHRDITPLMSELIRQEVLKGIDAYYEVLRELVPVFTGRLRYSFAPLGEALVNEGVRRNTGTQDVAGKIKEEKVSQSTRAGFQDISAAAGTHRNWTKVRVPRKAQSGQYTFTFSSKAPYYGANDTEPHERIKSAPWYSQQNAMAAFRDHVTTRIPKIAKGILVKDFKSVCDVTTSTDPLAGWNKL